MRYSIAAAIVLCASAASAGPLDFLNGIPDAPGVVRGGSFGLTGNDYYGTPQVNGAVRADRATRQAKARLRHPTSEKQLPRS